MISVYGNETSINLSPRRIEVIQKYEKIILLGRKNPVWFIETIFKVPLLDYQKWVIMNSWNVEKAVWLMSRNAGKSFLAAVFMMAKSLLYPSFNIYIMSLTSGQAQDTFKKLENIAKKNISSLIGTSDVYLNEVVKLSASDGFIHNKNTWSLNLFNGSHIESLVGTPKNVVGKRSNLNIYDEAGKISEEFFSLTEPFTTQDSAFKTGVNVDNTVIPRSPANQCLYMSSAEDTSSYLYAVYKNCAKGMLMGRKDVFCADISCEMPLHPTKDGKPYSPLLKQSVVDSLMATNEYKALREYYNLFDTTGGTDAVVSRDIILRNEKPYLPVFSNDGKTEHIFGLFYDPALVNDNSFVLTGEFWKDEERGWMARVINGINLIERLNNGEKKLLAPREQLEWIRRLMLAYNGPYPDYQKLHVFIDPGSGGGGRIYSDFLIDDFFDSKGNRHVGIVDENDEVSKESMKRFPQAQKGVLQLLTGKAYKNEMYAAAADMLTQDLITFPAPYSGNSRVEIEGREYRLTTEEIRALVEIDLTKEEFLSMKKTQSAAGNIIYTLPPDKARKMHDDRAYCLAALCHFLSQLRIKDQYQMNAPETNMAALLRSMNKQVKGGFNKNKNSGIFTGTNPFAGRR